MSSRRILLAGPLFAAILAIVVASQMGAANASPKKGANVVGPYTAVSTGGPSLNGASPASSNKPAAGSVGNADNKNPHGQLPSARLDGNNGYECDGNNGIGKGNPAHTGCVVPHCGCESTGGQYLPPAETLIVVRQDTE